MLQYLIFCSLLNGMSIFKCILLHDDLHRRSCHLKMTYAFSFHLSVFMGKAFLVVPEIPSLMLSPAGTGGTRLASKIL